MFDTKKFEEISPLQKLAQSVVNYVWLCYIKQFNCASVSQTSGFLASSLCIYDFSTLYSTLPHNIIKDKLTELIEQTFNREGLTLFGL